MAALTHATPGGRHAFVDGGVAGRCRPGGTESGDRHLVRACSAGVLLAAIDGLGHGEHVALALVARIAGAAA